MIVKGCCDFLLWRRVGPRVNTTTSKKHSATDFKVGTTPSDVPFTSDQCRLEALNAVNNSQARPPCCWKCTLCEFLFRYLPQDITPITTLLLEVHSDAVHMNKLLSFSPPPPHPQSAYEGREVRRGGGTGSRILLTIFTRKEKKLLNKTNPELCPTTTVSKTKHLLFHMESQNHRKPVQPRRVPSSTKWAKGPKVKSWCSDIIFQPITELFQYNHGPMFYQTKQWGSPIVAGLRFLILGAAALSGGRD